ncbi:MAG: FtsX-like permease family protein [Rhodoferax sp.]
MNTRWSKLWRDLRAERWRYALMALAMAVSVAVFGSVLGARDVLQREMARNYQQTQPAHATLELRGDVDAAVLAWVRRQHGVAMAEAADVLEAQVWVRQAWTPVLLFVADDFGQHRLNHFFPSLGLERPAPGHALMERSAAGVLQAGIGQTLTLRLPGTAAVQAGVDGLVHDPSLAPAWQERTGYLYIDRPTLAQWGGGSALQELRVRFDAVPEQMAPVQARAQALAQALQAQGWPVQEVRVPPPAQHPHQRQMETVLLLLLVFSGLVLLLSGVVAANALAALLARQTREIAVMKTIGARADQLVGMYVAVVGALGMVALLLAWPAGWIGTQVFARAVAELLNLALASAAPSHTVAIVQAFSAVLVPLALAALPIARACRASVRTALDQHGVATDTLRRRSAWLPPSWRQALRKPARLALNLGLLMCGGAMFMTALNVSLSWDLTIAKVYATRHYDIEIRARDALQPSQIGPVAQHPAVRGVELWGYSPAAFARAGQVDLSHTYPDRGHGSFAVMAPPPATTMVGFPVLQGHWLQPGDPPRAVVLNHAAAAQLQGPRIGEPVHLSIGARPSTWRLVGIVEEVGAAGVAYVHAEDLQAVPGLAPAQRLLRIASHAAGASERAALINALDTGLADRGAVLEKSAPLSELRTAMGDHIAILIQSLVAMAAAMAIVGGLGLASNLSVSVLERQREFAVMKTLGATPGRLQGMVLREALSTAVVSVGLAVALSLPLTYALDAWVGRLGFVAPLPFATSGHAIGLWLALVLGISWLAALGPARTAMRSSVATALRQV